MDLKKGSILRIIKNHKFLVIFIFFLFWILFIDTNSWLKHRDLNKSIEKLEDRKGYYKEEISKDRKALKELENNPEKLEKYARERFLMKKENEDIFIIKEDNK
ncbi:MAG: septum formation initiator family protein [Bacteroidota bacterium]